MKGFLNSKNNYFYTFSFDIYQVLQVLFCSLHLSVANFMLNFSTLICEVKE